MADEKYYTYDDVLLVPKYSEVRSRNDVSLKTKLGHNGPAIELDIPLISSNMDSISGEEMIYEMDSLGGLGILHRFMPVEKQVEIVNKAIDKGIKFGFSVGVGEEARDRLNKTMFLAHGKTFPLGRVAVCIDVAHGHSVGVIEMIKYVRNCYPKLLIIAGNIATVAAAKHLNMIGADVVKVGCGPGSLCATRLVTGFGVPQLSAVGKIVDALRDTEVSVIADGGIRYSGDAVKALAIGADAVMVGRVLAGSSATPGGITNAAGGYPTGGPTYKTYRGMASLAAQEDWKGELPEDIAPEGESSRVPYSGPTSKIVKQFCGGIRSGCSYAGASNLQQLRENATFIEVSSATRIENTPHGMVALQKGIE